MYKRIYEDFIKEHFKENRQMLFITGPRQAGKTTTTWFLKDSLPFFYFSWDNIEQRELILKGPNELAKAVELGHFGKKIPYLIFDEIHKYKDWKTFLKGLYDSFPNQAHIIVTGSAKLDFFKKGGDSLMGRYFLLRLHPFSLAELVKPTLRNKELNFKPKKLKEKDFENLFNFGGFPDPYIKANSKFYNKWKKLRFYQLFNEDLRDLSKIQEVEQLELLAELIRSQAGQLVTFDSLSKKVRVASNTIRKWLKALQALYYIFEVRPYFKNISRSLLKEPKYYLWDWSLCNDVGIKAENFIASHLLKAIQFWTDYGFGTYNLHFLRDKNKREVDFLITKDQKPWILLEVKKKSDKLSNNLEYFQKQLNAKYVFQIVVDAPYVNENCFIDSKTRIVPA
nr:hypothetical protein [Candidatus Anoxychlamydiales bacterium]